MIEERINELLPLAARIAREFSNIPGLPHAEIEIVAQEALTRAAHAFDSTKGDFTAYASTAMRNALRDLYERQCRHLRHHLLTGKFPYRFDPKRDPIDIILNENPVPLRERLPSLEKSLSAIIDQSLLRNPKDRFQDAGKLLASLSK